MIADGNIIGFHLDHSNAVLGQDLFCLPASFGQVRDVTLASPWDALVYCQKWRMEQGWGVKRWLLWWCGWG